MTNESAIRVDNLCKEFTINHSGIASVKSLVLKPKGSTEILKVLKGVTFDVKKGECVAIVGRNGAGKSTLLALIARVYRPTSGTIAVNGRVAPLLELGAGFHPELTGIDNIFVNGMILGSTRKQLNERLDTIIEFSELYKQIDTPVRTYSSGMAGRLGFAIAVHVDADILIVDEALAVGDFAFRAKCQAKIAELRKEGRTVLMVSHGEGDIRGVADRCIWLQDGQVQMNGEPGEVLEAYRNESVNALAASRPDAP